MFKILFWIYINYLEYKFSKKKKKIEKNKFKKKIYLTVILMIIFGEPITFQTYYSYLKDLSKQQTIKF